MGSAGVWTAIVVVSMMTVVLGRCWQACAARDARREEAYRRALLRACMRMEVASMSDDQLYGAPALQDAFDIVVAEAERLLWP